MYCSRSRCCASSRACCGTCYYTSGGGYCYTQHRRCHDHRARDFCSNSASCIACSHRVPCDFRASNSNPDHRPDCSHTGAFPCPVGLADTWPDRLTLGRSDTIPVCCTDSCSQHLTESQSLISTEPEAICKPIRGAFVESNGLADG